MKELKGADRALHERFAKLEEKVDGIKLEEYLTQVEGTKLLGEVNQLKEELAKVKSEFEQLGITDSEGISQVEELIKELQQTVKGVKADLLAEILDVKNRLS